MKCCMISVTDLPKKPTTTTSCLADIIYLWLVTSAKQQPYPCSGPTTDSTKLLEINALQISTQPDWQIDDSFFDKQANHGA